VLGGKGATTLGPQETSRTERAATALSPENQSVPARQRRRTLFPFGLRPSGLLGPRPRTALPRFLGLVFLSGALAGPVRGLLPVYAESTLHQPPAFSSLLLSLLLVGGGIFALVGGALADRLGPKRTLVAGLAWLFPAALLFRLDDPGLLLAIGLVAGLIDGLYVVGGQSYLVGAAPKAHLGLGSALFFLGSTLGTSLGSLVAGWVAERSGFGRYGLALLGAGALLVLLAIVLLPATARQASPAGQRAGAAAPLRTYRALLASRPFLLVAAVRLLPTLYWGAATVLLPLLLYRLSGTVVGASLYLTISLSLAGFCQLLTGRLADRLGRGWPVLVLTLLLPLSAAAAALSVGSYELLFAAGVLTTCVAWSISVTFPPLVRELTGPTEHGRALGLLHLIWVIAMIAGANAGGRLVDLHAALPFALAAALNLPTALAGLTLHRQLRRAQPIA
jgi:MFS family permease